jgi:hypothetical protein
MNFTPARRTEVTCRGDFFPAVLTKRRIFSTGIWHISYFAGILYRGGRERVFCGTGIRHILCIRDLHRFRFLRKRR